LQFGGAFNPCDHEQPGGGGHTPDPQWRVWRADGESKKADNERLLYWCVRTLAGCNSPIDCLCISDIPIRLSSRTFSKFNFLDSGQHEDFLVPACEAHNRGQRIIVLPAI
jgi:hypothetical protein